jgi:metal-responsive CopG/Arc/MetJ family transcriptional regulator
MLHRFTLQLCVASESHSKVNQSMLVLELFLRGDKRIERVVVEMSPSEAKAFVGKLREIERVKLRIKLI